MREIIFGVIFATSSTHWVTSLLEVMKSLLSLRLRIISETFECKNARSKCQGDWIRAIK